MARSSASPLSALPTSRGASVTLASTVMCGNRLYAWNTTPIRRRTASASTRGSVMSSPSSRITPSSTVSSRLMQRSRLDLPDPDAPISVTTWCSATSRSIDRSTVWVPNRLTTPSQLSTGTGSRRHSDPLACCRRTARRLYQSATRIVGIASSTKSRPATRYGVKLNAASACTCAYADRVEGTQHRDQPDVLLQGHEVVEQWRGHPAYGLRKHHPAHRLPVGQPQRPGRRPLARVHRLDAGPEDLRDVRRVGEHQCDGAQHHRRGRHPPELQSGQPEAHEVEQDDQRHPAEEVGVRSRQRAHREPQRPAQRAQRRDEQPDHDDEHRGDGEHPDVEPEAAQDVGQRVLGHLASRGRSLSPAASRARARSPRPRRRGRPPC